MTLDRNISRTLVAALFAALAGCSSDVNAPLPEAPPLVASASLSMQSSWIQIGSTGEIVANVKDAAGLPLTDRAVAWSSSDASVASVEQSGAQRATVTAKLGGSAIISAVVEGVTAKFEIITLPVAASSAARSQAFIYSPNEGMVDIGTLPGGSQAGAQAINARGEVAGWSSTESSPEHAFKWSKETGMIDLGVIRGTSTSEALGINSSGEVVGLSGDTNGERAFRWTPAGGIVDMGVPDGSVSAAAFAIADDGTAVGTSQGGSFNLYNDDAVMWTSHNGIITLDACGADDGGECSVIAYGLNQGGSIVGQAAGRATLWTTSGGKPKAQRIGVIPGADYSGASAINDLGQAVGTNNYLTGQRAFLWTASAGMRDLGAIPGTTGCAAAGINNHGQVVGLCL